MKARSVLAAMFLLTGMAAFGADRAPATCSCDSGPIVDADGRLNTAHCDAPKVLAILDRYAGASARLLPERVGPPDVELAQRKLERPRREAVADLLEILTREELDRLFPVLTGIPPDEDSRPGTWPGGPFSDCDKAVYWINTALSGLASVDQTLLMLTIEDDPLVNPDPNTACQNEFDSPYFVNSRLLYPEVRSWLQLAADAMSNGMPVLAALDSYVGWWRAGQVGWGFIVAFNYSPINADARCTEISGAGVALGPVAQAAQQANEWAQKCAGTGGFFF